MWNFKKPGCETKQTELETTMFSTSAKENLGKLDIKSVRCNNHNCKNCENMNVLEALFYDRKMQIEALKSV